MKRFGSIVSALVLTLTLVTFGASAAASDNPFVFTTALSVMPSSLDPTNLNGAGDMNTSRTLYEPLVEEVRGTTELEPWLAASWENPDASTYIFHLRENVKFHDGTVMDADDVVYTFQRAMALTSTVSSCVSEIAEVTAVDPLTVEIKLNGMNSGFLYNVAKIGIISKEWCVANEVDGDWAKAYLVKHSCGTGAYAQSDYVDDQYVTLTAFPDYWGGWSDGQIDVFRTVVVSDSATQVQMLCAGQVDKLQIPITEYLEQIQASGLCNVLTASSLQTNIFTFNMGKFPFNNNLVREAVTLAFNYQAAVDVVYNGYATIPSGFMSVNWAEHNANIPEQAQDMEKAKELMAESGVGECTISIHLCEGSNDQLLMAQILQNNLAELGITLNIQVVPWTTMAEEQSSSETAPEMSALNMGAFTGDAVYYMATNFETGGIYNWSFFSDKDFDACLSEARATTDAETRTNDLYKAQQIVVDQYAALWCVSPDYVEAMSTRIAGYTIHPLDYYYSIRPYLLTAAK
jgi:peptide/nickel transport system substrate-binding protein